MEKEEFIEETMKIMRQLDDMEMLKKIFTVAKTLLDISQEKQKKKGGAV